MRADTLGSLRLGASPSALVLLGSDGVEWPIEPQQLLEASDGLLGASSDSIWPTQKTPDALIDSPLGPESKATSAHAEVVPLLLARYLVIDRVGTGSYGTVYRARDLDNGEYVALKFLKPTRRRFTPAFKLEFRALAGLAHNGLLIADEIVQQDNLLVLVMPFVAGCDFTTAVRAIAGPTGSVNAPEQLAGLLHQLGDALGALHDWGLIHRDIKPANLLVGADGVLHVLDFGLVQNASDEAPIGAPGTLRYMAPEQLDGGLLSPATDLYAVGLALFEALAGAGPFDAEPDSITPRLLGVAPRLSTLRPGIEPIWDELCATLLSFSPSARGHTRDLASLLLATNNSVRRSIAIPFVGREQALATMTTVWQGIAAGAMSQILHISGPSGIGKTALLQRLAAQLPVGPHGDSAILWGRCFEREHVAYKGLDALIDEVAKRVAATPGFGERLRHAVGVDALARVFPVLGNAIGIEAQGEGKPGDRAQAIAALGVIVKELTPLLLVIDDAQWGDSDAADVLLTLLSTECREGVLLALTSRGDNSATGLVAMLERAGRRGLGPSVGEIALSALDAAQAREMLTAVTQDASTLDAVVARSEGNPFLLRLFALWLDEFVPGDKLETFVGAIFASLLPTQRAIVQYAALCNRPVPLAVLTGAADIGVPKRAEIAHLFARGLLVPSLMNGTRTVALAHLRLAAILTADLSDDDCCAMHARLARGLIEAGADAAAITEHLIAAGHREDAIDLATAGALAAMRRSAFAQAAELVAAALAAGAPDEDLALRAMRAHALRAAGSGQAAAELWLELARASSAAETQLQYRRAAAEAFLECGAVARGLETLAEGGRADVFRPSSAKLATGLIGLLLRRGSVPLRAPSTTGAVVSADAQWIAAKGLVFTEPSRGISLILQSMKHSAKAGHEIGVLRAKGALAGFVFSQLPGGGGIAARWLDEIRKAGDERADPYLLGIASLWSTLALLAKGQFEVALGVARAALDALEPLDEAVWERSQAASFIARALTCQGDYERCAALSSWHLRDAERRDDIYGRMLFTGYGTLPLIARGEADLARLRGSWLRGAWLPETYTVQRFYTTQYAVMAALYEGDTKGAVRLVEADRKPFKQAGLHRIVFSRVDWDVMELRVSLATSQRSGLRTPQQLTHSLERERGLDARAQAVFAHAIGDLQRGDAATSKLVTARDAFVAAGIKLERAVVDLIVARASGDENARSAARSELVQLGVAEPDQWARLIAPIRDC